MVSAGQTDEELEKIFKKYKIDGEEYLWKFTSDSCQGRAAQFTNGALLLRLRHFPETEFDYGILAHEIFHIGIFLMERIGASPIETGRNDEACAYVIQYLTQEIMKEVRRVHVQSLSKSRKKEKKSKSKG